ncbi:sporulation protein YtxC [Bacillus sp. REN3]|uniref:sporulation protein YtxC n=1 Tax=Bacillus sp. REN3 TaxID=2802440 RepID=UPI001AED14BC|nr:sporulation protein YtxC [Bacillus sp. REN3]
MIEIIFQKRQDAVNLYQHFIKSMVSWCESQSILLIEDRNRVCIPGRMFDDCRLDEIKNCFFVFITTMKRDEWLRSILRESYFYTEIEEQNQIMDIIYSVLEGNRSELLPFIEGPGTDGEIKGAIDQIFAKRISFSFDSFVMFRLKSYVDQLSRWIEVAIDEYKMEQEYQVFIQTLRDFLAGRRPQMRHLHLVIEETTGFFNSRFDEMTRGELFKTIDRKLLVNHPVYVDSLTIAPLLSIAPETIYLYTDDLQQPLVRTILNIFEERVQTKSLVSFHEERLAITGQDNRNVQ